MSSGLNEGKDAEFKAFSSDLCTAWLIRDKTTAPPLTPDAPLDTAVLYKRSNCGPTADTYESLLTVTPPHRPFRRIILELQGAPDVGARAFFGANDSLASGAPDPGTPVIDSREEGRLLYVSSSNRCAPAGAAGVQVARRDSESNVLGRDRHRTRTR